MTHPRKNENILNLILIGNPIQVKCVEVRSGIAYHDAVLSEVFFKLQISKKKPRLMHLYRKADWEGLDS